jgi:outer membrane protein OmpA-like peptidoglycan-associated protein/opacity protein-like surface antigen
MESNHKSFFYLFVLLSLLVINVYAQVKSEDNNFIQQNLIISLEGGGSYGFTDYKTSFIEPSFRASFEYYPFTFGIGRIGLKVFGGGSKISQSDSRGLISNNDLPNPRQMPTETYTDIINAGGLINFGLGIGNSVIPYLGFGGSYIEFNPKNSDGSKLDFNLDGKYDKTIFSMIVEGGVKITVSDRFSLNASVSYYPITTDYLEDISASKSDDSFISVFVGISYAFMGKFDNDGDGIDNHIDMCPDEPEDFDGFEDEDGCPDLDNDKDGILDINDKCPNEAEDKDGYKDEDGCPDPDNDGDGIIDINDKCPDEAEDFDGFQDEDGCPDIDNDGDGIFDVDDKCPDEAETINGFEDEDGCPDTAPALEETFYQFLLRGDDTFEPNTATIKESIKLLLNEIAFYIKNQVGSKWKIEGHTDNQGSASMLKKLSEDRAKAIYNYFINEGLPAEQFEVIGYGNSSPITTNNTAEGRSTNRRILIIREE